MGAAGVRLTAAVLIGAVRAVGLFITLVTGWDAGAIAHALKLLGGTPVAGTLGGCSYERNGDLHQLLITRKQSGHE